MAVLYTAHVVSGWHEASNSQTTGGVVHCVIGALASTEEGLLCCLVFSESAAGAAIDSIVRDGVGQVRWEGPGDADRGGRGRGH